MGWMEELAHVTELPFRYIHSFERNYCEELLSFCHFPADISKTETDEFLFTSSRLGTWYCLSLAAMYYGRVEWAISERLFTDEHWILNNSFFLKMLETRSMWTSLHEFACSFSGRCFDLVMTILSGSYRPESDDLFSALLEQQQQYSDEASFKSILEKIIQRRNSTKLKVVLFASDERVRRMVANAFDRSPMIDWDSYSSKRSYLLSTVCTAGVLPLLTGRGRPFGQAVYRGQLDLARFFYDIGAATYHELLEVSEDYILKVEYAEMAHRPRTLQSLCLSEVSKRVGWGCFREPNLNRLNLPEVLKDALRLESQIDRFCL